MASGRQLKGLTLTIDGDYVRKHLEELEDARDFGRYIL